MKLRREVPRRLDNLFFAHIFPEINFIYCYYFKVTLVIFFGQVKLGFGNAKVDDLFFASGYNIHGSIVSKVKLMDLVFVLPY